LQLSLSVFWTLSIVRRQNRLELIYTTGMNTELTPTLGN